MSKIFTKDDYKELNEQQGLEFLEKETERMKSDFKERYRLFSHDCETMTDFENCKDRVLSKIINTSFLKYKR